MSRIIGRNTNSNTEARVETIEINSVTATVIAAANGKRISFFASLSPDNSVDVNVAIRYYPAADDNLFQGDILVRYTSGNSNLFKPDHKMDSDNMYYGEISAISESGTHNLYITEY